MNMDLSEELEHYEDVYGHSFDEGDTYIPPKYKHFTHNRDNSEQFHDHVVEEDFEEEDESDEEVQLAEQEEAKLESCLEFVKSVCKPMRMSREEIVKIIISEKFDCEKIVDSILKSQCPPPKCRRHKDETISLVNSNQSCCNPMDRHKLVSPEVDPQSKLNICMFNTQNSSQLKKKNNGIFSENFIFAADTSDSQTSKESKENCKDHTIQFLSGIKRLKKDNLNEERLDSPAASFLSRMKLHSKEADVKENKSPEISFLSRISGKDSSCGSSSKLSKDSNVKTVIPGSFMINSVAITKPSDRVKIENSPLQFNLNRDYSGRKHQKYPSNVPLNGMSSINDKMNLFLGRTQTKETLNSPEQTRSDITCTTRKSLSKDFSKLQLTEVKSMSGIDQIDSGTDINLVSALQRNNFDNLKFRPTAPEEKFDIPFVDCECDENIDNENDKHLECTMDLSYLAARPLFHSKKKPSPLGRAFCLKYRIAKVKKTYKKEKTKLDSRLVVFDFLEPSPDDQIKKHIKRHL